MWNMKERMSSLCTAMAM